MRTSNNFGRISALKILFLLFMIAGLIFGLIYETSQKDINPRKIFQLICAIPFAIILLIPMIKVIKSGFVYKIIDGDIIFRDGSKFHIEEIDCFIGYPNILGYDVKFYINEKEFKKSLLFCKYSFSKNIEILNDECRKLKFQ